MSNSVSVKASAIISDTFFSLQGDHTVANPVTCGLLAWSCSPCCMASSPFMTAYLKNCSARSRQLSTPSPSKCLVLEIHSNESDVGLSLSARCASRGGLYAANKVSWCVLLSFLAETAVCPRTPCASFESFWFWTLNKGSLQQKSWSL